MDTNINNDLKGSIRSGETDLSSMYDENISYEDIVKKDVLELMGFSADYPQAKKDELHKVFEGMLENRVAEQIFDRLNDLERNEYDNLLISNKNEEAYKYLTERGIFPEQIMVAEALILKLEFYEDSKVVREESNKIIDNQGENNG